MKPTSESGTTLWGLWKQFLPLSLSDVTMMFADPAITTTLAHMPGARSNMAAVGVAKALAIFFESPIIMLLHASNTLGASRESRRALWRFTLLSMVVLSGLLGVLALPWVFQQVASKVFGIDGEIAWKAQRVLLLMALWPAAIAWRRYFQGLLIRYGHGNAVGRAGLVRLFVVVVVLIVGYQLEVSGFLLAGVALVGGVIFEALVVTMAAKAYGVELAPDLPSKVPPPTDLTGIWRFYWPLANSMLVVWGGRAILIAVIARAEDSLIALAAWPAAWGLIVLIGNSTRMVQQIVIRHHQAVPRRQLALFTLSVGVSASATLLLLAATPWGRAGVAAFLGKDPALFHSVAPVLLVCVLLPFLIAVQNAMQGFLMVQGRTARINAATWFGTFLLLASASLLVRMGYSGAMAAAVAMFIAIAAEAVWLSFGLIKFKT